MQNITAIILAAGAATRMGSPKQLLDWGGQPLVRAVASQALAANCRRVVVVLGAAHAEVAAALDDLPVDRVVNAEYAEGQSTSLRTGIAALEPTVDAALVLLVDQPFVTTGIIEEIIATWHATGASIVAPSYRGQRGNPVLFARAVFPELLTITGDQGARLVLAADPSRIRLVPFDDDLPLADIDTLDDYARLLNRRPSV
jgi:molybdenum cofactor cytidylyltransferase